ncbi:MAG: hypothetical protein M0R17_02275 [Candidatus Omnitrophica bacterium]|nr:hypothetical protein [Candidatus Omnitrophota bacterium]
MERANFFNDQDVMSDDLNAIESTTAKQVSSRSVAPLGNSGGISTLTGGSVTLGGIYGSPNDYLVTTKNFYCNQLSATQISVTVGSAIDPSGNIILLNSTHSITLTDNTATSFWIDSTAGIKYIKIKYQESSGSLQSDDLGATFYTRYYDSYQIRIEAIAASVNEIPLGRFTADGSGNISGIITDMRQYCRTITPASSAILDPTIEPAKTLGWVSVEDHVKSIGHATPTNINPHGQNLADLGYTGQDIAEHERTSHVNGIILLARDDVSKSSYLGTVKDTGIAYIEFTTPSNAKMLINGSIVTGSIPNLYAVSPLVTDADYWVVADSTCHASFVSKTTYLWDEENPHKYPQYLLLGSASVSDNGGDISYRDMRQFYTLNTADIYDVTALPNRAPESFNQGVSSGSLQDELRMIRGAIGLIATGSVDAFPGNMPLNIGSSGSVRSLANQFSSVNSNASKTWDIYYHNNKPCTIFVEISVYGASNVPNEYTQIHVSLSTDGINPSLTMCYLHLSGGGQVYAIGSSISFFVPPGMYYALIKSDTGIPFITIPTWTEYY